MLLELRSAGSPSRKGWPHKTSEVYERDEKLLCCGKCDRQWTEPRVLITRPDGSCEEG